MGVRNPYPASSLFFDYDQKQVPEVDSEVSEEQQETQALLERQVQLSPFETFSSCTLEAPRQQPQNCHLTVTHDYHDHADEEDDSFDHHYRVKGGVLEPFPMKLHEMLIASQANHMEDIVSWQPHGRCFVVHKPKDFVALLPQYFKLSKLPSFQRQLSLYGFQRITQGRDRGGYYHEFFLRDREFLVHSINRIRVKGTRVRARSSPDQEPDFWSMPWVGSVPEQTPSAVEPRRVSSPLPKKNDDEVLDAFDKKFHFLNPFHPSAGNWDLEKVDRLLETEAKDFFEVFEFEVPSKVDVEDDDAFGDLLEQMMR